MRTKERNIFSSTIGLKERVNRVLYAMNREFHTTYNFSSYCNTAVIEKLEEDESALKLKFEAIKKSV